MDTPELEDEVSPSLMTCGQWPRVFLKNGLVTPRMTFGLHVCVCVYGGGGGGGGCIYTAKIEGLLLLEGKCTAFLASGSEPTGGE